MLERSEEVSVKGLPLSKTVVSEFELVKRVTLVINYDQPVDSIALPQVVRYISSDVKEVKTSRSGMAEVTLVLLKKPNHLIHRELKTLMSACSIGQAGLHEIFNFASNFLGDLIYEKDLRIIALLEEMKQSGVEFIPTILCNISGHSQKKWFEIRTLLRDDLTFQNIYVLGVEKIVPLIEE